MIKIRPSDYYSISYDAAAPNRIDKLNGSTHQRYQKSQQKTISISQLRTVNNKSKWSLGLPTINEVIRQSSVEIADRARGISSTEIAVLVSLANSFWVVSGSCSALFEDLDMADDAVPVLRVQPRYAYKQALLVVDGASPSQVESQINAALDAQLQENAPYSGLFNGSSDSSIVLSTCARVNVVETKSGEVSTGVTLEQQANYTYITCATAAFNGTPLHVERGVPAGTVMRDVWSGENMPTFYYKLGVADFRNQQVEILDRNTVQVRAELPIAILAEASHKFTNSTAATVGKQVMLGYLEALSLSLEYPVEAWRSTAFSEAAADSDGTHPYQFSNDRVANINDRVGNAPWADYFPQKIFNKYALGKYYIQLRMRAKFMLINDLRIDSEVQIYDLRGRLISRNGVPCTFKIKRILKEYGGGEFTYTINCLEE